MARLKLAVESRPAVPVIGTGLGGAQPVTPRVLILGPARESVSGVAAHVNQLFRSNLTSGFRLSQYQVGSEGRVEGRGAALLRLAGSPFGLAGRILREAPKIVHINTTLDAKAYWRDLVYMTVAKCCGSKVAYQVHGGPFPREFFPERGPRSALLRHVLCWADAVVVLSTLHMDAYRKFSPTANLVMIGHGVELPEVDLGAGRYLSGRPLELVYFGRLVQAKGVFDIIEAVRILRQRNIAIRLRLAGSGPAERALRRAVAEAGLEDCMRFLGAVGEEGKRELWKGANVLVLPSHTEGLPCALLECMAAGIVPVVTAVGGIGDAVQDRVHGLLVPPRDPRQLADALEVLHEDREALRRMALAGRQHIAERYSLARFQADFRKLYAALT